MYWRFSKYGWRLFPGGLTTLIAAALLYSGALQPLEHAAYSMLFRLRGEQHWDDRLALIAIDDASLKQIGRFPWSRDHYVKLLNQLSKNHSAMPSVVVFDLLWSESSPDDAKLAQAIAQQNNVVLAQARDGMGLPLVPVPLLQKAAIATGQILNAPDSDGITRRISLQDQDVFTLGLAAVEAYTLVRAPIPRPSVNQPLWINWPGSARSLPQYSFADVVRGTIPPTALKDKIVLVGVTATGIDPLMTPFDYSSSASGVDLNAAVINTLLQQNALQPLPEDWFPLILILGGPILSLMLSRRHESLQIALMVGLCAGWGGISLWAFRLGYWLPVVFPLGLFSITTIAVMISDRLHLAGLLQQQIQQLWRHYQPDLTMSSRHESLGKTIERRRQTGLVQSVQQLATLADQFARSQSTQAVIAHNLSIGLLAADLDGVVWFCNPAATNWLHVMVGSDVKTGLIPSWFSDEQWQTILHALAQQRSVVPWELYRDEHWFELKLEPLTYQATPHDARDTPLQPNGFLLVLEDISLRKQVETALEAQVRELQRVAQLKDDFLNTVSHELRSPMANIKMAIELLKITRSPESSAQYLKILQNECTRETNLINDLLDLQRLEAGSQTYQPEQINLNDWLPPLIQSFSERAETQQQNLHMELPPRLPALVSDQPSLERIVVELVNNACKYTPPDGDIKVVVNWTPPHVEFIVDNSGTEIPEAEIPRIFEKFYRVPQADPWKRGGTGLGLALVSRLVECLGGKISVDSGSGHTTFTVKLPLTYEHPSASARNPGG